MSGTVRLTRAGKRRVSDAVVILDVFAKKTETTPTGVVDTCRKRLADYLKVVSAKERR